MVQGQQFTDTIALEYASKVCHPKESKREDEEGLVKFPETFGKESSWRTFKKVLRNYLGTRKGINGIPLEYISCAMWMDWDQSDYNMLESMSILL